MDFDANALFDSMSAAALLLVAVLLFARSEARSARFLALYLALTGTHFVTHAVAGATTDPRIGQATLNAGHLPWLYAPMALAVFATTMTRTGDRVFTRPAVLAALAMLPTILVGIELLEPSPFWLYSEGGEAVNPTRFRPWGSLHVITLYAATFGTIGLLARALARAEDPQEIPGLAILLSAFTLPAVVLARDILTDPYPWRIFEAFGGEVPSLLPRTGPAQVAIALLLAFAPLALVTRPRLRHARPAAVAATTLAATVGAAVAMAGEGSRSLVNLRWVFFALLVVYASIRHGLLGTRRVEAARFEVPLAAAGFAVLALLFVASVDPLLPDAYAVTVGIGLALVAGALAQSLWGGPGVASALVPTETRYRVERALGEGARGRAVLALDRRLSRSVVLKTLPAGRRALSEARAFAAVSHPSLVTIHDVEEDDRGATLVLEYVAGGTLEDRLARGRLSLSEAKRLGREIAAGLGALHRAGLVHGDVKASNVFLRADGRAALGDFGEARPVSVDETVDRLAPAPAAGSLAGVAPETLLGGPSDGRADIYALGALLYRAITGDTYIRFPPDLADAREAVLAEPPRFPHARIPPRWEATLARALEKDPERRFKDADALEAALAASEG
ncbi:MAG: serine/threonine-protein kinase [Methanobacteriota archaeon]